MFPDAFDWVLESDFDNDFEDALFETELTPDGWLWITSTGQELTLAQMETKHIFNVGKMFFNHLASEYGGQPIWFTNRYAHVEVVSRNVASKCAAVILFLFEEVLRRGDLPLRFREPFYSMLVQIAPITAPDGRRMLAARAPETQEV